MNPATHRETFCIDAAHPALPGHFPGHPLVPGVVVLDHVVAAIEHAWQVRVCGLPQVKFLRPLAPGTRAELIVERAADVRFRVTDAAGIIASGSVELSL